MCDDLTVTGIFYLGETRVHTHTHIQAITSIMCISFTYGMKIIEKNNITKLEVDDN